MKRHLLYLLFFSLCAGIPLIPQPLMTAQDKFESFTRVGQQMPLFTVTTLDGVEVSLKNLKGKVVLINFWATWCAPCRAEMPRLEKEVWQSFRSPEFVMVAIAREQSKQEITVFRKKFGFSFPMAPDPKREAYRQLAGAGIPRNYVIGREGRILFQSVGYNPAEFDRMKEIIRQALEQRKEGM